MSLTLSFKNEEADFPAWCTMDLFSDMDDSMLSFESLDNDLILEDFDAKYSSLSDSTLSQTPCQYKSQKCKNKRATRRDGTLLRLCEFHRTHQNEAKKRSDMKLKNQRKFRRKSQATARKCHNQWTHINNSSSFMKPVFFNSPVAVDDMVTLEPLLFCNSQLFDPITDINMAQFDTNWDDEDIAMLTYYTM